jgi:hypothetical protein
MVVGAVGSTETSLSLYQTTHSHIYENNLYSDHGENLTVKSKVVPDHAMKAYWGPGGGGQQRHSFIYS